MSITREARHLSGADLGKTITIELGDDTVTGTLSGVTHTGNLIAEERLCTTEPEYTLGRASVIVEVLVPSGLLQTTIEPTHPVNITGTDTPAGLDLHKSVIDQDG